MINSIFGQTYADQYDLLYGDKDYEAECNLIEGLFQRHGQGAIKSILDLGCGTGNHAIQLARRGYRVTGVDLSPEMLVHAAGKAVAVQLLGEEGSPHFVQGDARSIDLDQQFDAVIMMFAVLGYQLTNTDLLATLRTVRQHLRPGGIFVFDVWYGPAVLTIRPSDRVKITQIPNGKVLRSASSSLDTYHQIAEVRYQLWRISDDQLISETEEIHRMRYFFSLELDLALTQCGLKLKDLAAFPNLDQIPNSGTWNVLGVAS